ncbi:MAG TPA: hypothetical protein VFX97_01390 [Pyrinomonadaceae bacterium]|nr:hypothetical protein [Pyrinomonadaceae bacterium]
MKFQTFLVVLFTSCLSATALGQQAKLEGQVFDDKDRAVVGVRIVAAGGQAAVTDSKGHFKIGFPSAAQPGQATRIKVVKSNWVIFQPMLGNCITQSTERNFEPLRVVIVPKGSPLALSPRRLSQVIDQWTAERVKLRTEVGNLRRNIDEYAFLRDYAKEYGFTLEQFRDAAEQWGTIKDSDDKEERALKQYWQKNYEEAALLATESYKTALAELAQAKKKTLEVSLKVIRRSQLAGNSYYAQYKFREALITYNELAQRFEAKELPKEELKAEWAATRFLIGNAKVELGQRVGGEEGRRFLVEAVAEFRQSATFHTREQLPQDWATSQNNLGSALVRLGERVSGVESIKYLDEAVAVLRASLEIRTRKQLAQDWAVTQNDLGVAFLRLGERASGSASITHLTEAIAAYRAALEVIRREASPQVWATVQNNLGSALAMLAVRVNEAERGTYLGEAIAAFRASLEIRTRAQAPQDWAETQLNMGNALSRLGEGAIGLESTSYLNEAVAAYRGALEITTRAQLPLQWTVLQTNLGIGLMRLGQRAIGEERIKYLNEALTAYHTALKVITREDPHQWAAVLINLGLAHLLLGEASAAAEAFANVLTVDTGNKAVFGEASRLYHEVLFDFDKAFLLNQNWLANHPLDILVQADFAEAHFSIGRFADCRDRINALLAHPDLPVRTKTALRAIEIASLLAESKAGQIGPKVDELIAEVARQPPGFKVEWSFAGTQHFINQNEKLSPYRVWLAQLFGALAIEDRELLLKALQNVRANFKEQG